MHISKTHHLRSSELYLRIPNEDDLPHVFSASQYEGFTDGMPWSPPKEISETIEPLQKSIKAWQDGRGYSFSILDQNENLFYGRISIRKTKETNRWNIGFWTHPEHQKRGIMTKAVRLILKFGFETLQAKVIEAEYATWNIASEKVLHKNGFEFVKFIEEGFKKNGVWVEEHRVEIYKDQFLQL